MALSPGPPEHLPHADIYITERDLHQELGTSVCRLELYTSEMLADHQHMHLHNHHIQLGYCIVTSASLDPDDDGGKSVGVSRSKGCIL